MAGGPRAARKDGPDAWAERLLVRQEGTGHPVRGLPGGPTSADSGGRLPQTRSDRPAMAIQIRYLPNEPTLLGGAAYAPTFVCDICGEWIEDIGLGAYVFVNRSDACPQEPLIVHKGRCHDEAEERLTADEHPGAGGWAELKTLPARLANNSNPEWPTRQYVLVEEESEEQENRPALRLVEDDEE